ncbi:MAG: SRPBCC domain-containing protein [Gemmatimonadetes bacterium]|nr:SRPBCC domain-containing protein [Gemmatimonadota bacterium]
MTQPAALHDQVLSIEIEAPIERVWNEITKTGSIQRALYNTILETDLKPGSRLRYYSPNKKRVFIVGEVVEVSPPTKFSHTYLFLQNMAEPTLVTWELQEIPAGCRVRLTHSGWTEADAKHHKDAKQGWTEILGMLKQQVETGDIPRKFKVMYALMGMFMVAMPKRTKVEEVDKAGW